MDVFLTEVWKGPAEFNGWVVQSMSYDTTNGKKPEFVKYGIGDKETHTVVDNNEILKLKDSSLSYLLTFAISNPGEYQIPLLANIYSSALNKTKSIKIDYNVNVSGDNTVIKTDIKYGQTLNQYQADIGINFYGDVVKLLENTLELESINITLTLDDKVITTTNKPETINLIKDGNIYKANLKVPCKDITYGKDLTISIDLITKYRTGKYVSHSESEYTKYRRYSHQEIIKSDIFLDPDDTSGFKFELLNENVYQNTLTRLRFRTNRFYNGYEASKEPMIISDVDGVVDTAFGMNFKALKFSWPMKQTPLSYDDQYIYNQLEALIANDKPGISISNKVELTAVIYKGEKRDLVIKTPITGSHTFKNPPQTFMEFNGFQEDGWGVLSRDEYYNNITVTPVGILKDYSVWTSYNWATVDPELKIITDNNGLTQNQLRSPTVSLRVYKNENVDRYIGFQCTNETLVEDVLIFFQLLTIDKKYIGDYRPNNNSSICLKRIGPSVMRTYENTAYWSSYESEYTFNNWVYDYTEPGISEEPNENIEKYFIAAPGDRKLLINTEINKELNKIYVRQMNFLRYRVAASPFPNNYTVKGDVKRIAPTTSYPSQVQNYMFPGNGIKLDTTRPWSTSVITQLNSNTLWFASNTPAIKDEPTITNKDFTIVHEDPNIIAKWNEDGDGIIFTVKAGAASKWWEAYYITLTYQRPMTEENKDVYFTLPWYRFAFKLSLSYNGA